jgi:hypothetical protein
MASAFLPTDVWALSRLVCLIHEREMGEKSAAADAEARQIEDRYGLSPLSRRRLSFEIAASTERRSARPRVSNDVDPKGDPREALVDGSVAARLNQFNGGRPV